MDTRETVEAFVAAINTGDPQAIGALMSEEHMFIDSLGSACSGRAPMVENWRAYFGLFPDYQITVENMLADGKEALLYGKAAGTLHHDGTPVESGDWEMPAAWRAVVEDAEVTVWQVFADNAPVTALL